jgi:uncharacterized membrane protein YcaP (DUF421 family)
MGEWFTDDTYTLLTVFLTAVVFYIITILASRITGIRSFTSTSSFDFLITLAMGALLASTVIDKNVSVVEGSVGLITLYILQSLIAIARKKWSFINKYVDNQPIMLMEHGYFIDKNMAKAKITKQEIRSKLRGKNIKQYSEVRAVVMEPSGSISVITLDPERPLDPSLLEGVKT